MRMASIASGSSGNCIYIGSDSHHILIDDGISGKRTAEGLRDLELSPADLDGILITHEHADHVKGLGVFSRRYGVPLYATEETIRKIRRDPSLGVIPEGLFHVIERSTDFSMGDLDIHPFPVPHDAADPVAFRVSCGSRSAAVVTDLGDFDEKITDELRDLDVILVEANHDIRMLQVGPYPYALKQRILSSLGHMCNEAAGKLLTKILHDNMKYILLGHLSRENNYPDLALETVKMEITLGECPYQAGDFPIMTAPRETMSRQIVW